MLAAVDAPSSSCVPPRITRFVVSPVRITATAPKNGPNSITRWCPRRSDRTPKIRRQDELGEVERRVEEAEVVAATTTPPCSGSLAR